MPLPIYHPLSRANVAHKSPSSYIMKCTVISIVNMKGKSFVPFIVFFLQLLNHLTKCDNWTTSIVSIDFSNIYIILFEFTSCLLQKPSACGLKCRAFFHRCPFPPQRLVPTKPKGLRLVTAIRGHRQEVQKARLFRLGRNGGILSCPSLFAIFEFENMVKICQLDILFIILPVFSHGKWNMNQRFVTNAAYDQWQIRIQMSETARLMHTGAKPWAGTCESCPMVSPHWMSRKMGGCGKEWKNIAIATRVLKPDYQKTNVQSQQLANGTPPSHFFPLWLLATSRIPWPWQSKLAPNPRPPWALGLWLFIIDLWQFLQLRSCFTFCEKPMVGLSSDMWRFRFLTWPVQSSSHSEA